MNEFFKGAEFNIVFYTVLAIGFFLHSIYQMLYFDIALYLFMIVASKLDESYKVNDKPIQRFSDYYAVKYVDVLAIILIIANAMLVILNVKTPVAAESVFIAFIVLFLYLNIQAYRSTKRFIGYLIFAIIGFSGLIIYTILKLIWAN